MRHVAKEGRTFVISACQVLHLDDISDAFEFKAAYLGDLQDPINPGLSMIVDPDGRIVAGPLDGVEGILYANVDPDQLIGPRWQLDVAGHYSRPHVFELRVHRNPRPGMVDVNEQVDDTTIGPV